MQLQAILKNRYIGLATLSVWLAATACAATFGTVVPIGGPAADIALDEPRGVLYIANYTSSRIDIMSLSDYSIGRSITVPAYPGGVALSPNGQYLVITQYASTAGGALAQPGQNALTVLDLTSNGKRTFSMGSGPVAVAFGIDGMALILTQDEFLLFDPSSGATTVLDTVQNVASQTLPVAQGSSPSQILGGAITATADGRHIFGIGGTTPDTGSGSKLVRFSYNVISRTITANQVVSTVPSLGPRAISASRDGSYYMTGWALFGCGLGFLGDCTAAGPLLAQWPDASGALNVGSVAIRSSKSIIYAQITPTPSSSSSSTTSSGPAPNILPPNLLVLDADNLAVRERIQIPENLAGRSIFNSDDSVLYAISDSGVMVLPMSQLDKAPRVTPSTEDIVFRGNFCNSGPIAQHLDVVDPAGNATPFQVCLAGSASCTSAPGITISPSAGVTPARVTISIQPSMISSLIGTRALQFEIRSAAGINMPPPPAAGLAETSYVANTRSRFRVLINNREPENRGAFFDVPGNLVDILPDPARNRFYVLRQDKNQVQVYDSTSYGLITTLRTGNTPTSMAITFDQNYLLVGNDNSQIANRFDLNTLNPLQPIVFQLGHYPRSIAASGKAVLAVSRVAGPVHTIDLIDLASLTAQPLPSLGPYKNDIHVSTTLTAAPNGGTIMAAMPDGRVLLYNANIDAFTVSRQDFQSLKGALAASSYGTYVVDHYLLNESLVKVAPVIATGDSSSGFAFIAQNGLATAVTSAGSGYIQRLQANALQVLPTNIVEQPTLGGTDFPFRRTLAPLSDNSAILALTTSGFTVLPWNYDAATQAPVIDRLVSAADFNKPVAPGGLVTIFGSQLSPMSLASTDVPLPTVLADSCLTVNGVILPLQFVSPSQINAQLPFQVSGSVDVVLRTPGGISDALHLTIQPTAPSIFHSGTAGPLTGLAAVVRATDGEVVTDSNPIHPSDHLTIYLTGMGDTAPKIPNGTAAPSDPPASPLVPVSLSLGGMPLPLDFVGLTPGTVGVYQINTTIPKKNVPTGFGIPLTISQGDAATSVSVRVVN